MIFRWFMLFCFIFFITSFHVNAQSIDVIIKPEEAVCIFENADTYRSSPLDLIILVPPQCPEVENIDFPGIAKNSSSDEPNRIYFITQPEFECLFNLIKDLSPLKNETTFNLGAENCS